MWLCFGRNGRELKERHTRGGDNAATEEGKQVIEWFIHRVHSDVSHSDHAFISAVSPLGTCWTGCAPLMRRVSGASSRMNYHTCWFSDFLTSRKHQIQTAGVSHLTTPPSPLLPNTHIVQSVRLLQLVHWLMHFPGLSLEPPARPWSWSGMLKTPLQCSCLSGLHAWCQHSWASSEACAHKLAVDVSIKIAQHFTQIHGATFSTDELYYLPAVVTQTEFPLHV